jgi:hypothetical protein
VNVRMLTVTPAKGFCDLLLLVVHAAATSTATTRITSNPYRFIALLPAFLGAPGSPASLRLATDASLD